ncbi:hypothetical protein B4145_4548 [Bacillus subtilis]|uniref:Uncharacterized protein n=1 Tax=Bacillus subtilis subsp. subtilis TaxID=135461 RepID=A0ABD3ZZG3_BACIU|nr:hypothetical protein B4067_4659 [Bacillus subtilis subsp. subtilis]KIN59306.1 hypothetical protein B4145_4548 [Bacillus subtilis]
MIQKMKGTICKVRGYHKINDSNTCVTCGRTRKKFKWWELI